MPRFVLISLVCSFAIAGPLVVADETHPATPTVCLTVREPDIPGPAGGIAPMCLREVVRQAFLIAARDELGLSTRDSMLREEFPDKSDESSIPFEMFCRTISPSDDRKIEFVLTRQGAPEKVLWRLMFVPQDSPPLVAVTVPLETLSRTELKDVLIKAGFKGSIPKPRASSEVPKSAYDLLWTWNDISVMAGLRMLHAEIREKGESPELLAALAVGYANLGSLTERQNSGAHKVYYARAMLYQERLSKKTGDTPWSLYNSAYVAVQLGMPNVGAYWFGQAKPKMKTAPVKPLPFFANVMEAFCEGDLRKMLKVAQTPHERWLARYWKVQAVRFGDMNDVTIKAEQELLEDCPDCARVYDLLAISGVLGPRRLGAYSAFKVTGKFLRKRLLDVADLPEPARKLIRNAEEDADRETETEFRKELIAALKKAGAPGRDHGEPSLSALGHLIDDLNFVQAMRRLEFEGDDLRASASLCADHPYAAYIEAFTYNKTEMEPAARELKKHIDLTQVTFNDSSVLQWLYGMGPTPQLHAWHQVPGWHTDTIFADEMRCMRLGWFGPPDDPKINAQNMATCWAICSKLPIAVATRISRDWAHAEKEAAGYEKVYADDPLVLKALTDRYYNLKRYDDAERCAKLAVEANRGYPAYRLLAKVYEAKKDHARWKATLDKAIELPPSGLERAQVQNEIALDLLDRLEYREAVAYADAAAETGAAWSMATAARCHEMLGEWKQSEQFIRNVSENYSGSVFDWMFWCHRTGHGDVHAADELVRKQLESWGTTLFAGQYRQIAFYYLATREPDKAWLLLQKTYQTSHEYYAGIHAALVADSLGKNEDRDALLKQVVETKLPPNFVESRGGVFYGQVAIEFRQVLNAKVPQPLDLSKIDKVLAESKLPSSVLRYLVGVFLKNRGDLENAKKYLTRCAQADDWDQVEHVLACQLLREMKVEIAPAAAPGTTLH
ncbi:MAG TPA: tetratricopeptide repeat protein [Planctomycetaceae bacterium]|jgi:tetratricopeptide (TPR) repeat protein|nr:tetratricopeptide repeat protein [Planctomycetaceae bacterium]